MIKKIIILLLTTVILASCRYDPRTTDNIPNAPRVCYVFNLFNNIAIFGSGSATYIGEANGKLYFFTASHIIREDMLSYVYIKEEGKKKEQFLVEIIWRKEDLMIISCVVPDRYNNKMKEIKLTSENPSPGHHVFIEGYPNHGRGIRGRARNYLSCLDGGVVDIYFTNSTETNIAEWSMHIALDYQRKFKELKGHSGGAIWNDANFTELAGITWAGKDNTILGIPASVIINRIMDIPENIFPQKLKNQLLNKKTE